MLEDILLSFLKGGRPARYKGIGWRGGLLLALYWSAVCGVGGRLGWHVVGMLLSILGGGLIGYRLERLGGAIAVAVFTAILWSITVADELGSLAGIGLGVLVGFGLALKARE
jgi:hypothetical protein